MSGRRSQQFTRCFTQSGMCGHTLFLCAPTPFETLSAAGAHTPQWPLVCGMWCQGWCPHCKGVSGQAKVKDPRPAVAVRHSKDHRGVLGGERGLYPSPSAPQIRPPATSPLPLAHRPHRFWVHSTTPIPTRRVGPRPIRRPWPSGPSTSKCLPPDPHSCPSPPLEVHP